MPPLWSKSSSKEPKKKANAGGIFGTIQRKLKSPKRNEIASKMGLIRWALIIISIDTSRADFRKRVLRNSGIGNGLSPLLLFLLPKPRKTKNAHGQKDVEGDLATDLVFADSDSDSDDPPDSQLLSPQAFDYDTGNKTLTNSP
ncbi:hypothetical protein Tco_1247792, partial [Tanacetum coccineum]